jgi:hypothetical protein
VGFLFPLTIHLVNCFNVTPQTVVFSGVSDMKVITPQSWTDTRPIDVKREESVPAVTPKPRPEPTLEQYRAALAAR